MKLLAIALFSLGASNATPVTVALPGHHAAVTCSENLPASYHRPGGYCDQINSNNTLAPIESRDSCHYISSIEPIDIAPHGFDLKKLLHLAQPINPCCNNSALSPGMYGPMQDAIDRVHVATNCP